ncbi:MAG: hypothetical protein H6648_11340 [Caldilineae bacterium]|nr:hypothetical protein [Caldilineae bacterium]
MLHTDLLAELGIDADRELSKKVVSTMFGHSTIAITPDTYAHVMPSLKEDAAKRMDDLFGSG